MMFQPMHDFRLESNAQWALILERKLYLDLCRFHVQIKRIPLLAIHASWWNFKFEVDDVYNTFTISDSADNSILKYNCLFLSSNFWGFIHIYRISQDRALYQLNLEFLQVTLALLYNT